MPLPIRSVNRRRFVGSAGALASAAALRLPRVLAADVADADSGDQARPPVSAPKFETDQVRTISPTPELYCGWPTLTRRRSGQLIVVWSGGRDQHVCPFGRVDMMRSDDEGKNWTWPRTLLDGPIDDRDAGVLETDRGTLLVTTFTSLAYQGQLERQLALAEDADRQSSWSAERLRRWRAAHQRISEPERNAELGQWMIRSTDGGITWSPRADCLVNSPHGPIQLSNGRLLYAGKKLWSEDRAIGVCESVDDGASWRWLAAIPARPGDDPSDYHELHAVEASNGRLLVHIRNHNPQNDREILQSESDDGGLTWTTPHPIGVWGLPSFLCKLADGRLLMTYGHRRAPLGIQARLSEDAGSNWSAPMVLHDEGTSSDLGYPSTIQFEEGDLLSLWYEKLDGNPNAVLRQVRWRLLS